MTDRKHGIALSGSSALLIMNPQPVEPVVFSEDPPGAPGFWGWTDFHALYPVGMESLLRSITDLRNQASFCPHVSMSVSLCEAPGEPFFLRQLQRLTFDYFIYKQDYQHVIEAYRGATPDGIGRYVDFRLARVIGGGLTYCAGSWYLLPVVVDGREYTYARYYMVNCVQGLPGFVKFAMRTFPGIETPATMNAFYKYAKTLQDPVRTVPHK